MKKEPNILLIGPGAIGTYFVGRLVEHGASADVITRSNAEVLRNNPYEIKSSAGDFSWKARNVFESAESYSVSDLVADYIFICTKALPSIPLVKILKNCIKSDATKLVLIQNGIDVEREISENFPKNPLISCIAYIGVSKYGATEIVQDGPISLKCGMFPAKNSELLTELSELFQSAGVKCLVSKNIIHERYDKLTWNAPFNPLSVLCGGVDTKEMTSDKEIADVARSIMFEVASIARADVGIDIFHRIEEQMEYTKNFVPYKPSMLLDFERKNEMEVDAILGNLIQIADKLSVPAPHLKTCYALLKSINKQNLMKP